MDGEGVRASDRGSVGLMLARCWSVTILDVVPDLPDNRGIVFLKAITGARFVSRYPQMGRTFCLSRRQLMCKQHHAGPDDNTGGSSAISRRSISPR